MKYKWTGLLVEPNPKFVSQLITKNRNAWILPHCLSITNKSEVVEFDNVSFWGGIINQNAPSEGHILPGDIDRTEPYPEDWDRRTIKVTFHHTLL